uniref:Direct IAP-binding protein with low pI n=1 Tax=Callorhinchus milii TaxID=7868 RepID=A0A4W3HUY8_CALMI
FSFFSPPLKRLLPPTLPRTQTPTPRGWRRVQVGVAAALAAVPVAPQSPLLSLSHEDLIKRAASLATDGANTFLSQTTLAFAEALTRYNKAVYTLVSLQQRYTELAPRITGSEEDAVWQVIVGARVKIKEQQEACLQFEAKWLTAVKLSEMAAEAAYQAGADQASVTARTQLELCQGRVEELREQAVRAEGNLAQIQAEDIRRQRQAEPGRETPTPAAAPAPEEEIPEQYLRED